jgi:hypothetical protein
MLKNALKMKKILLLSLLCILLGNCQLTDDDVTPDLLPAIGLTVDETILVDSNWSIQDDPTAVTHSDLSHESTNANKLRHAKFLGSYIDDNNVYGWYDINYNVDSVYLLLDIRFPIPDSDGRSIYIQLIKKEDLSYVTLDPETDTYSYDNLQDFKDRFIHEGEYDQGDHFVKVISSQYESDMPDYENYALKFPTSQNDFRIRYTLDSDLGMLITGTFKGKCYMFSCGYMEMSRLENGSFNAFIGY